MALVPRQTPNQVQLGPATATKARGTSAPAFGEQIAEGGRSIARGVADVATHANALAEQNAETAAKDLDTQYAEFERATLYTGESAYFKQQGRGALLARPDAEKALAEKRKELIAKANSPLAARMFGDVSQRRIDGSLDSMGRYALQAEKDDYVATSEARIKSSADYAGRSWGTPETQQSQIAVGNAEIITLGQKLSWSPEVIKQRQMEFANNVHEVALTELIAADPSLAGDYFAVHEDEMSAASRASWAGRIKPAADRDVAISAGMGAYQAAGGDLQAAVASVVGNKDLSPTQVQQAQEVIRQQFNLGEAVETEKRETALRGAYAQVNEGLHPSLLPADTQRLLADQMGALDDAWTKRQASQTLPQNSTAYLAFRTLSVDDPDTFKKLTTGELVAAGLDHRDVDKLIGVRDDLKKGKAEKSDVELAYTRAKELVIIKSGGQIGTTNTRSKQRLTEAQASIMADIERRKAAGQELNEAAINQVVSVAMTPRLGATAGQTSTSYLFESKPGNIVRPGSSLMTSDPELWNLGFRVAKQAGKAGATPTVGAVGELLGYYEATGYKAMVPYRDISRDNRDMIVKWLKDKNMSVTEGAIEERYTRILMHKATK